MPKEIKVPAQLFRAASFETDKDDAGKLRISISSDEPYLRYDWWNDEEYYEVLDHGPGGMDDSRLRNGAALLYNHNRDIQLGRLDDPRIESGKCYVMAQLSDAEDVRSYRKRIDEGILRDTSVGYALIGDSEKIGEKDGIPIYKFRWQPYEGSFVTIPADTSVGAGRQRDHKPEGEPLTLSVTGSEPIDSKKRDTLDTPNNQMADIAVEPKIDVVQERQNAIKAERERVSKIDQFVQTFKANTGNDVSAIAARFISGDRVEGNFDDFRQAVLEETYKATPVQTPTADIGMSKKELRQYSLAKAIYERGSGLGLTGLEKEASDATAKLTRRDPAGFFIPEDWANRSLQEIHGLSNDSTRALADSIRALTVSSFGAGGALVGTELLAGSFVELLRNKTLMANGATMLSGLVGNVAIPKQGGGATAYWLPEGGSVTASDQAFLQLALTPHRLVAQTAYDKQLLAQASLSVEAIVRGDQARVMGIAKDKAAISGSGVNGQPLGILNTAGVQTVTFGAAATWQKILEFETNLATANADQTGTPVFVTSPSVRGKWKGTAIALTGATTVSSKALWENDVVNGYRADVTNQFSDENRVLFYVPSELIIADWAGIDVVVNPYSLDSSGQIRTTMTIWSDNGVRHPVAFVASTDSGAQ